MICSSNSWLRLRVPSSDEEAAVAEATEAEEIRPRQRFAGCLKRIFVRAMVATMGCLFSCFRVRDSNPSSGGSASNPGASAGAVVKKQRSSLSSLLVVSEEDNGMLAKLNEDRSSGTPKPEHDCDLQELKDEAKFLKACGTLVETPDEIRKASQKLKDSSSLEGQYERPEFKSWLTDSSIDKPSAETAFNYEPLTPSKDHDSVVKGFVSSEHTPSSCMTGGQNAESVYSRSIEGSDINSSTGSSVTTADGPLTGTCKNKSVRFDCDSDMSSVSSKSYSSERFGKYSKQSGSSSSGGPRFSPYPTPLKLSDEMQTPGTVFPAYMDATGQGNTRIRCQYVHPMESFPELKEMQDDGSYSDNLNNRSGESLEQQTDEESPTVEVSTDKSSGEKNLKFEASLSPWLRRDPLFKNDGHEELNGSTSAQKVRPAITPGDKPILGMVAAHWNDDEPTQNSPKWWGVNGIPNSTNKYKEDQKVSWHATPFEERLEKALSDENIISQRNQFSGTPPPDFSEAEESDTAVSQLQTSNHFKSAVSV